LTPENADFKVTNINQRLFTPVKHGSSDKRITDSNAMPKLLNPRSRQREEEKDIIKELGGRMSSTAQLDPQS